MPGERGDENGYICNCRNTIYYRDGKMWPYRNMGYDEDSNIWRVKIRYWHDPGRWLSTFLTPAQVWLLCFTPTMMMVMVIMITINTISFVVNIDSGGKLVMIVMTNIIVFVFTERRAPELNFKLEVFLPDSLYSPSNKLANEKDLPKLSTSSFATQSFSKTPIIIFHRNNPSE